MDHMAIGAFELCPVWPDSTLEVVPNVSQNSVRMEGLDSVALCGRAHGLTEQR